jgi:hypothetical protein
VYTRPEAPLLSWTSEHAATVEVVGPGVSSSGLKGSAVVCPTTTDPGWTTCLADPPDRYTYTATARDAQGVVVATATATLTVG